MLERFEFHALVEHPHHRRCMRGIAVEALGIENLRYETAISHRWPIAMAEFFAVPGVDQIGFDFGKPVADPVVVPGVLFLFRVSELPGEVLQHAQVVEINCTPP